MPSKRGNKYGAVRTRGFASKKEARRWTELELLQKAGEIRALTYQPRYDLIVNGIKVGVYTADAAYFEGVEPWRQRIVEDTKSPATAKLTDYRLRVKLFQALYPDVIHREV